jgi:hypothetical protein
MAKGIGRQWILFGKYIMQFTFTYRDEHIKPWSIKLLIRDRIIACLKYYVCLSRPCYCLDPDSGGQRENMLTIRVTIVVGRGAIRPRGHCLPVRGGGRRGRCRVGRSVIIGVNLISLSKSLCDHAATLGVLSGICKLGASVRLHVVSVGQQQQKKVGKK